MRGEKFESASEDEMERGLASGSSGKADLTRVRPRRYWCEGCKRAFTEGFEEVRKWGCRTKLGDALLFRELSNQSFGAVERKTGTGYTALQGAVKKAEVGLKWSEIVEGVGERGLYLGLMSTAFGVNRWWAPSRRSGSSESKGFFAMIVKRH